MPQMHNNMDPWWRCHTIESTTLSEISSSDMELVRFWRSKMLFRYLHQIQLGISSEKKSSWRVDKDYHKFIFRISNLSKSKILSTSLDLRKAVRANCTRLKEQKQIDQWHIHNLKMLNNSTFELESPTSD